MSPPGVDALRLMLFGSEGGFSKPLLSQLLKHQIPIQAIVVADDPEDELPVGDIPVTINFDSENISLTALAQKNNIPVYRSNRLQDESLLNKLTDMAIDIYLVACFPLKIPPTIWQSETSVCWNLHPSLLPRYRGPTPLYWQLHNQESQTGVTLHEVSAQMDAGDIVLQESAAIPTEKNAATLNHWVADVGIQLILKAIKLHCHGGLSTTPQDESMASYYPYP